MSIQGKITKSLSVGAILALSVGCSTTSAKAGGHSQLSLASAAPGQVKSAYSSWVSTGKLDNNNKEKCYGVALKGENDCGGSAGASCKGAKADCKGAGASCKGHKAGAKADCKGAGASCKGHKAGAKADCKGAGASCKGAKADCKGSGITCSGQATRDWQGDAFTYVPKGACQYIITPVGRGSLTPK